MKRQPTNTPAPKLRCKPGDLAYIVDGCSIDGRIVEVLAAGKTYPGETFIWTVNRLLKFAAISLVRH
jgi:hypothetical protein